MNTTQRTLTAQQQFEQLFQSSRRRAYNLAYHLTRNATDAEDLTQDAYLRAWHHFDRFKAGSSFEPWLFKIITNRAFDLQRRKKRVPIYSLDTPMQTDPDAQPRPCEVAAPQADPQEIVVVPLLEDRLEAALRALPALYQEAILLCDVEQWSYSEIAQRMDCPLGTVRSRVYRARQRMRRSLENGDNLTRRRKPASVPLDALVA